MVMFFIFSQNPEKIVKFFSNMSQKGIDNGYKLNINAYLWQYKQKGLMFFINYRLFPSIAICNWFFYFMFKSALKTRYKESCKYISITKGIKHFIDME